MTTSAFPTDATPAELLYPDMAQELATTRKMIALVPDGAGDFRPHEKSMTLGALATHLAELPSFGTLLLTTKELDFATAGWPAKTFTANAERLAEFDKNAAGLMSAVEGASWELLDERWVMRAGDVVYVDDKKAKLVRSFALSHMAHHRAQLGVYLRMTGVAIPGSYGPSADEK